MAKFSRAKYQKGRDKKLPTFEVELSTGDTVTLRPVSPHVYLSSGQLPASYAEKAMSMQGGKDQAETIKTFTPEERTADLMFFGLVIRDACVEPKIVENPKTDSEVKFSDFGDEDLKTIFQSAIAGRSVTDDITAKSFPGEAG